MEGAVPTRFPLGLAVIVVMGAATVAKVLVGVGGGAWGVKGIVCVELCGTLPGDGNETGTSVARASRGADAGVETPNDPSFMSSRGDCVGNVVTFCASATSKT